ncbi:Do family serine endopeptidase [Candidatus Omnitrophota bacterium]
MSSFQAGKLRIWVLASIAGLVAGVLLAVRFDLIPLTKAARQHLDATPIDAGLLENSFVAVAKKVGPAVVSISTEHIQKVAPGRQYYSFGDGKFDSNFDRFFRDFFGQPPEQEFRQRGLGSGFILDQDGYILTNQHVVQGADKITVTLSDGRKFAAAVKGSDVRSDLAVIKIDARDLPVLKLGDSDNLQIGQWAIAAGNPFGYIVGSAEPTVTAGIISALGRSLPQGGFARNYADLIQTDAAINPGNSGGPLVNIKGEVIGINVAIFSPSGGNIGIGFAIPVNAAKEILSRLIAGKKILYGWLGVSIQDLNEELANYFGLTGQEGALVLKVVAGSPAEAAGFQEGDVIVSFTGQAVRNTRELLRAVAKTEVNQSVAVEVIRERKQKTLRVKIGQRPDNLEQVIQASKEAWRGIEVSEISAEMARLYRLNEQRGVIITNLLPKSPADQAGLMVGDVIIAIDRQPIRTVADYEAAIEKTQDQALVRTERGFFIVKPK